MMEIRLDGRRMNTREIAHQYIKWKLNLPEYYGKNLDALWDMLSTYSDPIEICFLNEDSLIDQLGDYGEAIIEVFQDAQIENKNIRFTIED